MIKWFKFNFMRNDRHLAIELRRKGSSYNKICKELGIPKSTMHYWFRSLRWSQRIKKNLTQKAQLLATKQMKAMAKANKKRWAKWRGRHRKTAKKEFLTLKFIPLFAAGVMLYWGEGDNKPRGDVRLTNINPWMIKVFCKFLREICNIPKEMIHIRLLLYPDLSDKKSQNFWHKSTKIPHSQFGKSSVIYGRHPTKRLENGICLLRVSASGDLKEKIITWINLLSRNLINQKRAGVV